MRTHLRGQLRRWLLPPFGDGRWHIRRGFERGGLAEEVPRAVRIAFQDVRRDILREIPGRLAIAEREIDRGEVADVIAIARTDDERDDLTDFDTHVFKWSHRQNSRAFCHAAGEHLAGVAATHFERPGDAIAAFGMRIGNIAAECAAFRPSGLRHAMTEARVGEGCVAMLCAFITPGVRTVASDEFASTPSACSPCQPWMKA